MLRQFKAEDGDQEFTFEGKITDVCSSAGCWVNIDRGNGETFMVRFKDHFTIPLNTKIGSTAYLHGIAYMDTVAVEDLKNRQRNNAVSDARKLLAFPGIYFGMLACRGLKILVV
jgi:hypothetical protein